MLRLFEHTDIRQLYGLIQETIDVSYPAYYPDRAVQFFRDYHSVENITKRGQLGELIIIEQEDKMVATGSLVENEISGVFVLPDMQRMGLGKQIMLELESRAERNGISEIMLHVSLPSRKFYEMLNYEIGVPDRIDVGDGQRLKYWKGKKRIPHNNSFTRPR